MRALAPLAVLAVLVSGCARTFDTGGPDRTLAVGETVRYAPGELGPRARIRCLRDGWAPVTLRVLRPGKTNAVIVDGVDGAVELSVHTHGNGAVTARCRGE
jgi:hypothetical protein